MSIQIKSSSSQKFSTNTRQVNSKSIQIKSSQVKISQVKCSNNERMDDRMKYSMNEWIKPLRLGVDPLPFFVEDDTEQAITQSIIQVMHHTITACVGLAKGDQARHQSISRLPFFYDFASFFFVDGYKYHEVTTAISHTDEYMILSMELPATMEGLKDATLPDVYVVDYVKVYKKN